MAHAIQSAMRGLSRANRLRPALSTCYVRAYSDKIPDIMEHATGLEKRELEAIAAGNDDPFDMNATKRGPGTKDQPNLVASIFDKRMVGCICDEESTAIYYMWLHKGEPRRCYCGHWFKLIEGKGV